MKVGGHQASSASVVTILTALFFADLTADDRVAIKPHAAPVLHAIEYLLGRLPKGYLTRLRDFGGLQAYPSRTKDPFPVDFSTGSVGLGGAAPLFGALADRYIGAHFGRSLGGRFVSLLGDAELDEGNLWEAVADPAVRNLANLLWVVDLNRQSLDRVVPVIKARQLERQFEALGWNVVELKYGRRLRKAFGREGGDILRRRIDEMPNQVYQSLFGAAEDDIEHALVGNLPQSERLRLQRLLEAYRGTLAELIQALGGHDMGDLIEALALSRAEQTRPTVIFAYTVKGYLLPTAGRRLNHSALLTERQIEALRVQSGLTVETEWDGFPPGSPEGQLCKAAAARLRREKPPSAASHDIPAQLWSNDPSTTSTQATFGSVLLGLSRLESVGQRIVTVSPDVAVSTNLGGWINKSGVFGLEAEPSSDGTEIQSIAWRVLPVGRHIELGISEMNLFLALGQLGLTAQTHGERLFPIGTLYDPFVCRGLDALIYSLYSGGRFLVVGTPSGVSLSREGGAHQSIATPGIGLEIPDLAYIEPCFARELEWLVLDSLRRLQLPTGESSYFRLSTKMIDQAPLADLISRRGGEGVRADVLAGAFWLKEPLGSDHAVILATCGAMVPEVLEAARSLENEGVQVGVLVVSSPGRLYREWRGSILAQMSDVRVEKGNSHLERLLPLERRSLPIVSVLDGSSHALTFLGSCLGMRTFPLGVDHFGQSGSPSELYHVHQISPDAIASAAFLALE